MIHGAHAPWKRLRDYFIRKELKYEQDPNTGCIMTGYAHYFFRIKAENTYSLSYFQTTLLQTTIFENRIPGDYESERKVARNIAGRLKKTDIVQI